MEKTIYTQQYAQLLIALRATREAAGLTQVEVASRLDATQTFVSKCERGERRLDVIELREWCLALGTTLSDFVDKLELVIPGSGDR
ncbi:helix-turn-helix transcriptional regulator [Paraburkholderia sp. J63]|uniref:helix-turn-helix domain-containing protein n=1 Tax=Paraburkholderia sp. J63 TaxID=2805434 RepID=UPI002ABDF24D|nr:helix-turn-helix transcriptional regulator [Paraburkholderia sp. J63]